MFTHSCRVHAALLNKQTKLSSTKPHETTRKEHAHSCALLRVVSCSFVDKFFPLARGLKCLQNARVLSSLPSSLVSPPSCRPRFGVWPPRPCALCVRVGRREGMRP